MSWPCGFFVVLAEHVAWMICEIQIFCTRETCHKFHLTGQGFLERLKMPKCWDSYLSKSILESSGGQYTVVRRLKVNQECSNQSGIITASRVYPETNEKQNLHSNYQKFSSSPTWVITWYPGGNVLNLTYHQAAYWPNSTNNPYDQLILVAEIS